MTLHKRNNTISKHLVDGGDYGYKDGKLKFGYILENPERITPVEIPSGADRYGRTDVDIRGLDNRSGMSNNESSLNKDDENGKYTRLLERSTIHDSNSSENILRQRSENTEVLREELGRRNLLSTAYDLFSAGASGYFEENSSEGERLTDDILRTLSRLELNPIDTSLFFVQ